MTSRPKIYITGGAGYVGSMLSLYLAKKGYNVTILDLFIYEKNIFDSQKNINSILGDIRDTEKLKETLPGNDILIHLACISNDPSFELNPKLGKSINLDSFEPLVQLSKKFKIKKFIYASSSSVYGISDEKNVHEEVDLKPLTDYSKYKASVKKFYLSILAMTFVQQLFVQQQFVVTL